LVGRFEDAIAGLGPDALQGVLRQVLGHGVAGADPFERTPPPSQRRPRRAEVVTYRVRVDLVGTKPPLWRRLELASNLFLHEVHDIVQTAFGWTDSHLHRFGRGPQYFHRDTEYYLCPFEVEEGEEGVPEHEVRLDEVLVETGDTLFYNYDFGDDWQHTVKLEKVMAHEDTSPRAVCTGGRRPGPAEDCGGIHGYEMIVAATDSAHPDHREAVAEYSYQFGEDADPVGFAPTPFDLDEINKTLAGLVGAEPALLDLPVPVQQLVEAVRDNRGARLLLALIGDAALDQPVQIDADTATRMVRPYTWLLNRVGADGITLTGAGYLPPAHVEAAVAELGLANVWIGKGNREVQTLPVLDLRESAQRAGLLRKHRGKLVLTARGRTARTDPVALWWQLAEKTPPRSTHIWETQAGLILLVMTAAQSTSDLNATATELLGAIGWTTDDGSPLTGVMTSQAAWDTAAVLRRMGALDRDGVGRHERPTPQGALFARAALTTWS
jgi:hypothetical protein